MNIHVGFTMSFYAMESVNVYLTLCVTIKKELRFWSLLLFWSFQRLCPHAKRLSLPKLAPSSAKCFVFHLRIICQSYMLEQLCKLRFFGRELKSKQHSGGVIWPEMKTKLLKKHKTTKIFTRQKKTRPTPQQNKTKTQAKQTNKKQLTPAKLIPLWE